jgi:predicted DNA-binding protein (MmcQ/YjbR family)
MANMPRLEAIALDLPEATRVDIEAWDGEPTFRVRKKNFVFTNRDATGISVKLSKEEAEAVIATEPGAEPTGYGLGRYGWVSIELGDEPDWDQVTEWVRTSYTLVAPKTLARRVLEEDGVADAVEGDRP